MLATDNLQMIANGLTTVPRGIGPWLSAYVAKEPAGGFIRGRSAEEDE